MHFSRPKRLSSSPIGPDEARHCGTVSVVQYTEANWPHPATSGGLRRPEAHVSEDGQSLSCAGAVVREAPEAQGDGAAVTRICPRWRGRAAAVVAAAASWRGTAEDLTPEPELPRQSWSRSSPPGPGASSDTPASEPSPQPSFLLSSSFLAELSGRVEGEGPGTPQTPFARARCKCHYRHGPHHLLPLLPPLRQEADAHFEGWIGCCWQDDHSV